MSFLGRKNQNAFQGDGYYDTDPVSAPEEREATPVPSKPATAGGIELKVVAPTQFDEVSSIADALLSGCTVFLNMETTPKEIVRRLIDFLSGVAYSINGQIRKVTLTAYIITPSNVDVTEAAAAQAD